MEATRYDIGEGGQMDRLGGERSPVSHKVKIACRGQDVGDRDGCSQKQARIERDGFVVCACQRSTFSNLA